MATRGFEYAYSLDGSTPLIKDLPVNSTGAFAAGDLVVLNSSGYLARVTSTTGEVTGVMQETRASGASAALMKCAIITRDQVWRCSMDAATTAFVVGYTKTVDTVDHNTLSSTDSTGGCAILWDKSELDDDGNVLAYVLFAVPTFA